jgi:hypothetical protein
MPNVARSISPIKDASPSGMDLRATNNFLSRS